jgi:C-terminal processing protease CtpA/Prc
LKRSCLAVLPLILNLSCGGGSESPSGPTGTASPGATGSCSTTGQVTFVRDTLQNIYFWYKELPTPALSGFSSPEAYLEAVRYKPLDTSFSYITGKAESDAFYSDSQFIGLGFSMSRTGESEIRFAAVFPDSPASEAGLLRGDYLLSVAGKPVADLIRTGEINTIFGANTVGVTVDLSWRSPGGSARAATLRKRLVTIPTVSDTRVIAQGNQRVGYIHFRNFVQPSVSALNTAFTQLQAEGANELVLDLRYNGGGLVSVAQQLGGLIGGVRTAGSVFCEFFHNDKNASRNSIFRFEDPPAALDLSRLVVITTRSSASASEAVVNGLRPFIPVAVVGDTTYGKPVGQYGYDFCDKVLYPVAFQVRNARGEGDYYTGIPADCAAGDDLDHALGDPSEASLAESLAWLRTGSCSGRAAASARAHARARAEFPPLPANGWQQLVGAY